MTHPHIPPADVETRLRDAALVLVDLAVAATPHHEDEKARMAAAYGLAVQALIMAEDLRPGAPIKARTDALGQSAMMARIFGAASGVGETIGCLRSETGQTLMIVGAVRQLGEGVALRNRTIKAMGIR